VWHVKFIRQDDLIKDRARAESNSCDLGLRTETSQNVRRHHVARKLNALEAAAGGFGERQSERRLSYAWYIFNQEMTSGE